MALNAGTNLGAYQIVAAIGAGGMGEVYRARDTRLDRDVAIKVLPPAFAADAGRRERFEREAKAVAALSHPNIVAIHDTGVHEGQAFVVMELLHGDTLRAALEDGALPLRKAIDVGVQVARGLAAAHDKGLVHRDLKPDNVFLLTDGQVKILDFGLARHTDAGSGVTETRAAITDPGTVVGTAGYMAPEQVRSQAVDARTDLFAFGAVLYEILSGRQAFRGETPADTMFAVVKEDPPDLTASQASIPPGLDRIVRHCLEKNPEERFQSARDVAFALEALSGSGPATGLPLVSGAPAPAGRRWWVAGFAAGVAAAGAVAAGWAIVSKPTPSASVCAAGLEPAAIGTMASATSGESLEIDPALSPDGKLLAYAAGTARRMRVYVRPVGGGRVIQLSDASDAFEYQPRWSPDGTQILYVTRTEVRVAPSLGGASRRIATGSISSAAWSPDGTRILVARGRELSIALLDGGTETALATARVGLYQCDWSADGARVACAFGNIQYVRPGEAFGNLGPSGLVVVSAADGQIAEVVEPRDLNTSPGTVDASSATWRGDTLQEWQHAFYRSPNTVWRMG